MKINLRAMRTEDYEPILKLVITTWDYRSWVPKRLVEPMAEFFLSDLLQRSDHIMIAEVDGKISGICAGDILEYSRMQRFSLRKKTHALGAILAYTEKGSIFEKYIQTMELDQELLLQSEREFDGSLNLLIVAKAYQGLGLGKLLYNNFCEYLKKNGARSFYLYTDDSSDYAFYKYQGMQKLAQKTFYWDDIGEDNTELYFLYGKEI